MKLKFTHTTFEKVLNTVYITSFIYIFGLLITNIINYYQSNKWRGNKYPRKDGKIKYKGSWKPEGDKSFPWEKLAYKVGTKAKKEAEKKNT